jgi:predicted nucleotidyltransferase
MRDPSENPRTELINGLQRFVSAAQSVAGVRKIALMGSIVTAKPNPKDIDVLVVVADDADLTRLATHARRLQGHAQSLNRGADVFLADERGDYIGRTCRWKDCRPGIRQSCDARHCGRRPHLHDDFDALMLSKAVIAAPPVTLWPVVERRGRLPRDLEAVVAALEHAVEHGLQPRRPVRS